MYTTDWEIKCQIVQTRQIQQFSNFVAYLETAFIESLAYIYLDKYSVLKLFHSTKISQLVCIDGISRITVITMALNERLLRYARLGKILVIFVHLKKIGMAIYKVKLEDRFLIK